MHFTLGLSTLLLASAATKASGQLTFTAIPDQADVVLQTRADSVSAYLENYINVTCGHPVTITYNPVQNYQDAVDALLDGTATFGWYGGLTGVQAGLKSPPSVYLTQRIEDTEFTSVFIQGEGLDLPMGIQSANNKSLAFGSESSTSGHLMPQYFMNEADPPVIPSSTIYTGSHDATVNAVISGQTEVGSINFVTWKTRVDNNTTNGTSVFYTTPEFVDYLWVAGADIGSVWNTTLASTAGGECADINTFIIQAFVAATADDPLGEALLNAYSTVGYVAVTQGEYDPIEETGCALGLIEDIYCSATIPPDLGNIPETPTPSPVESAIAPAEPTTTPPVDAPAPAPTPAPTSAAALEWVFLQLLASVVVSFTLIFV